MTCNASWQLLALSCINVLHKSDLEIQAVDAIAPKQHSSIYQEPAVELYLSPEGNCFNSKAIHYK